MTWTPAPRLRTLALVIACAVGIWMLARGRAVESEQMDQVLRGVDDRDLRHEPLASPAAELVAAIDEQQAPRIPVSVQSPVADEAQELELDDPTDAAAPPVDDRVHPFYTFWDDSGGPPMLDDELTLTLVERADSAPFEPWSTMVSLGAVRDMQPKYSVAMPLPAPGLYRATCKDGSYKPIDVWVPDVDQPRVTIVLETASTTEAVR